MNTNLIIIGAGPFGLAMAAHAKHLGINFIIVGRPMEFWKTNMPEGMYLRSACDWHLDPENEDTIEKFLAMKHLSAADVEPLSRNFYCRTLTGSKTKNKLFRSLCMLIILIIQKIITEPLPIK